MFSLGKRGNPLSRNPANTGLDPSSPPSSPIAKGRNNNPVAPMLLNTKPKRSFTQRLSNYSKSFGLRKNTAKPMVAAMSEQASNIRATADTAATGLALAAGVISIATLGAAIPFSAALLGLSILIQRVATQVGINIELQANLMIIQHEVDRFYKIAKTMETIAKEQGFELNTGSVKAFVGKLTSFIALLSNDDVVRGVKAYRQTSTQNPLQTQGNALPGFTTIDYSQVKGTLKGRMNRTFAAGEYLRQLVRDITILTVFMTILLGEFQLFMLYAGNPADTSWAMKSPEFQSMLFDTLRLAGVPPKKLQNSPKTFLDLQKAKITNKLQDKTLQKFYQGFRTQDSMKQMLASLGVTPPSILFQGGGNPQVQSDDEAAALAAIELALGDVDAALVKPDLKKTLEENKEKEVRTIAEELEEEGLKESLLTGAQKQALEQSSEEMAKQLVGLQETQGSQAVNQKAEQALQAVAAAVSSTSGGRGKRRQTKKRKRSSRKH